MTARTPVERGAEAIAGEYDRRGHLKPGTWWSAPHRRADLRMEASAAFESIDREGLARLIAEVDISWHAMRGLDGQEQYDITLADAIIAYLTGDRS